MKCDEISSANIRLDPIGIPNRKVTTNADRIRNMSDEKLAEFIQEMKNTCLVDFMGYADKNCEPFCEQDKISCKDCQAKAPTILEWLQSEAE